MKLFKLGANLLVLLLLSGAMAIQAEQAQRVVSIDGSITEIIYALGQQHRLVGVDTTSRFPQQARQLPQVGYMRQLSAEGILSLQPDLVLTTEDAGPAIVFEQLAQAGVEVIRTSNTYTVDGVLHKIVTVANALTVADKGIALQQQVKASSAQALGRIPTTASPATLFLLGAGDRGMMGAGNSTKAAAILDLVGATNAMDYSGYKPISPEGAIQAAPDIVIVAHTRPGGSTDTLEQTLAMTPAQQQQRVYNVDVSLVLGFGPRLPEALNLLIDRIWYPKKITAASLGMSSLQEAH